MALQPISMEILDDGRIDLQSLASFMQDSADTTVSRRIASDTKTLDYYLGFFKGLELVYSQQSGTVTVNGVETKTVTQAVQDAINDNASIFKGDKGDSGTIEAFTVSTGAAGTYAQVTLGGTPQAREINLTVPRGDKGETGNLPNIYSTTTLDTPNVHIASDGTFKRSDDTNNAASRKVGTAAGNLVERDANGYPTNNNAIGVGQTWQDVTASRAKSTTYTNSTGRPIIVSAVFITSTTSPSAIEIEAFIDSVSFGKVTTYANGVNYSSQSQVLVPSGATYRFVLTGSASTTVQKWMELR